MLLNFINRGDPVFVLQPLANIKLTSKLENIMSLIPFGVGRINELATMTSNKPSTFQHSACSTEAVLFYLSVLYSVHGLIGSEELQNVLECGGIGTGCSSAIKPQHLQTSHSFEVYFLDSLGAER